MSSNTSLRRKSIILTREGSGHLANSMHYINDHWNPRITEPRNISRTIFPCSCQWQRWHWLISVIAGISVIIQKAHHLSGNEKKCDRLGTIDAYTNIAFVSEHLTRCPQQRSHMSIKCARTCMSFVWNITLHYQRPHSDKFIRSMWYNYRVCYEQPAHSI